MKIYFFGADYPPTGGGIATYSYEWIQAVALNFSTTDVRVLIFGNKKPRHENNFKIEIRTVRSINFLYIGMKVFLAFLIHYKYDVFHSLNLFPVGFWVAFWGKVFRKKTFVTFYGTDANDAKASKKTLLVKSWTLHNVTHAITISNFTKDQTEKKYKLKIGRIKVIYPVVPKYLINRGKNKNDDQIEKIKKSYDINDEQFVILSISRLVRRKGIEYLIQAVRDMNDKNVRLLIIGEGPEKEKLQSIVSLYGMRNRAFFLGNVKDISSFYAIANVSALVSYSIPEEGDFEGLGLVLLEAQSYGLPVIGSDSGGIPEAFEHEKTGLLVPPQNIEKIKEALVLLKVDKDFRFLLSKNTTEFLDKRFGFDNTIKRYIELCEGI